MKKGCIFKIESLFCTAEIDTYFNKITIDIINFMVQMVKKKNTLPVNTGKPGTLNHKESFLIIWLKKNFRERNASQKK